MKRTHGRGAGSPLALLLIVLGALLLLLPGAVSAAKVKPPPTIPCRTPTAQDDPARLIEALDLANATSAADTLYLTRGCTYRLAAGPYVGTGSNDFGPNGLPIVTAPLTIVGNGATIARDAGTTTPHFRFFQVSPGTALTLDNVTLTGGRAIDAQDADADRRRANGGAILALPDSSIVITNSTFTGNRSGNGRSVLAGGLPWQGEGGFGGAVFQAGGTLTIDGSRFTGNSTGTGGPGTVVESGGTGGAGGAIAVQGGVALTVTRSVFTANATGAGGPSGHDGGSGGAGGDGGAFYALVTATATITGCEFGQNSTGGGGGGVAADGDGGNGGAVATLSFTWAGPHPDSTTIDDSTFTGNSTGVGHSGLHGGQGGAGGAVYASFPGTDSTLTVTGGTFEGNTTGAGGDGTTTGGRGGYGGAIAGGPGSTVDIDGASFTGNATGPGGTADAPIGSGGQGGAGGAVWASWGGSTLTLADATFTGNATGRGGAGTSPGWGGYGGALYAAGNPPDVTTVNVRRSTFTGNQAGSGGPGGGPYTHGWGGAIAVQRMVDLTVTDTTVSGNTAGVGGGIDITPGGPEITGTVTVTGTTIAGNSGTVGAGGIHSFGVLSLVNSTVTGNTSGHGGPAIWNDATHPETGESLKGTVGVVNSTIAGNAGAGIVNQGEMTLLNTIVASNGASNCQIGTPYDVLVTDLGGNLAWPTLGGCPATFLVGDPQLGRLASNGGPTQTMALKNGSAAIDAAVSGYPPVDQRGVTRPQGTAADIGAYELVP